MGTDAVEVGVVANDPCKGAGGLSCEYGWILGRLDTDDLVALPIGVFTFRRYRIYAMIALTL